MAERRTRGMRLNTPWRARLIGIGCAGVAVTIVLVFAPRWLSTSLRAVAAYDAAAAVLLAVLLALGIRTDPKKTQRRAAEEDPGRNFVLAAVLISVAAGLGSAVVILGRGPHVESNLEKDIAYLLAIAAVALGWGLIHTMFAFRYAHLYYFDDDENNQADRGLTFPGTECPSDIDFLYFSFVIGMTYQVSDVQITDTNLRRVVLYHALVSFAYATMIVALVINIVSGLLH